MDKNLYDNLIKPLGIKKQKNPPDKVYSEANTSPATSNGVWIDGQQGLEGLNLSFAWDYHDGTGRWDEDKASHIHGYPEIQFFVGLDTAAINYLGADIEYCLGDETEPHTFSEPTVVVVPAGVRHGPVTTKRMYSPRGFGSYTVALTSNHKKYLPEKKDSRVKEKNGYAHLLRPLKNSIIIERKKLKSSDSGTGTVSGMKLGPGNADHLAWMQGKDLEGLEVNMDWGFFSSPGIWHRGVRAHVHTDDEILVFLGTDPKRGDLLGAEIELELGKEHELHFIKEPCIVVVPAGLPHGPFVTRWVDRAFAFFSINLADHPEMTFIN